LIDDDSDKPMVRNAADAEQVKNARRREKQGRDAELADIRAVMDTPAGRRLVRRLLDRLGLYRQPFDVRDGVTAFNCGEHNAALFLFHEVNDACPDLYMAMLAEATRPGGKS
jgi:hypothetical protein